MRKRLGSSVGAASRESGSSCECFLLESYFPSFLKVLSDPATPFPSSNLVTDFGGRVINPETSCLRNMEAANR